MNFLRRRRRRKKLGPRNYGKAGSDWPTHQVGGGGSTPPPLRFQGVWGVFNWQPVACGPPGVPETKPGMGPRENEVVWGFLLPSDWCKVKVAEMILVRILWGGGGGFGPKMITLI